MYFVFEGYQRRRLNTMVDDNKLMLIRRPKVPPLNEQIEFSGYQSHQHPLANRAMNWTMGGIDGEGEDWSANLKGGY